jgi:cell division protein FtsW (lipid II flippase)
MSFEEKGTWAFGIVTVLTYAGYLVVILGRAGDVPLVDVDYVWPMLVAIGAAIVINILVIIAIAIAAPKEAGKKDERDREINRRGEYIGQSMVVVGGVAALFMAMLELEYFWIANVIYLCFVLSALLATTAKLVAYRKGFVGW